MSLTSKQKKFADEYIKSGNATTSYQKVYKCKDTTARTNGSVLLTNANLKDYIQQRNEKLEKSTIASMEEVKEYWTNILRTDAKGVKGGLKASEYIAKTNAAFIEKIDAKVTADVNITLEGQVKEWAK